MITPALAIAWWENGLSIHLPQDLVDYLEASLELNSQRSAWIFERLDTVTHVLNAIGVEPLLLKGASHLVEGLYADSGVRMMTDIDLLGPESRREEAVAALRSLGRVELDADHLHPDHHQHAMLAAPGDLAGLELHIDFPPPPRRNLALHPRRR